MARTNGFPDYLSARSEHDRTRFSALDAAISAIEVRPEIQKFVFRPNQIDHPDWDDADQVFWKAVEELYLAHRRVDGELPVLYWGFHSYDLLARRSSNGVLVTDRSIYVMDVGRAFVAAPLDQVEVGEFARFADVIDLGVAQLDIRPARRLLDETAVSLSLGYLAGAVRVARDRAPSEIATSDPVQGLSVEQLIERSSISSAFALGSRDDDAKRIAKLAAKWKLPADEPVVFTLSNATFAGIYGLAVTDAAVYTRDLMEPLERVPRDAVDVADIRWEDEKKGILIAADHVMPTLPVITADNREYVVELIRSLLAAR